ncbi:hypothetical protein AXG93_2772s1010 [Marchantia polymorpha subsp. ruderalis]|uniref:Reverse transcriptase/retrotransposon-derived protein RNase H-like domain-containing protein n=1 Tax=Marchantia polymorpha subsp. ruderalis TaxID=1480154 RepID=A0A176WHB2_MARPO|nr:hypothetical protein AXG93_2772s1010 [Marchantia polymorpha subsp. ruderalis]
MEILTSSVVNADVPSVVMMRMSTLVLRSPLFSATELMNSGIDLARVFRVAAMSCERGRVTATSVEICEDTVEEPSSTSTLIEETSWQAAAARMESLPARRAIDRERIVLVFASVAGFSEVLTWPDDLLEGNMFAADTSVYKDVEEVVSFAAAVSSSLDVPLWSSCQALQLEANRLAKKAWNEASLPTEAERASGDWLVGGPSALSPLITTSIAWEYFPHGVCMLDLFGEISTGLAAVLHSGIPRDPTFIINSILDASRHFQVVRVAYRSLMALVNRVGQPKMALPTLCSYPASHAYRDDGPRLLWNSAVHQLVEPNADERERAREFMTNVTATSSILEASRRQVLGQAMDMNCLTWIVSLGLAEQRRLRVDLVVSIPLVSSLPTEMVVAMAGGRQARYSSSLEFMGRDERTCQSCSPCSWRGFSCRGCYEGGEMERDLIQSRTLDLLEAGLVELSHDEYASVTVMPVKNDTVEQHHIHLQIVLERLRAHGLRLDPGKSKFFQEKVEYLDQVIYPGSLGVQQAKVEAIACIPCPTDVSRVRAFMGLANYYQRYVKVFSAIAKPLNQLLKLDEGRQWGDEQKRAFVELKAGGPLSS